MKTEPQPEITNLIGKTIKRIVCPPTTTQKTATYILFDDGETLINLYEQDYYSFHDCSSCAREINVRKNKAEWDYANTLVDAISLT